MGRDRVAAVAAAVLVGGLWAVPGEAQSFYKGKTVRIVVGSTAGGGLDAYARAVGRHLGKHIPGTPTVIVENMPGAGSLIAANHVYRVARPDGLTLAHFLGSHLLGQALGQPGIEFEARKFQFLGAANKEDVVCGLTRASGITTLEQWLAAKTPVKVGAVAPGAPPDNTPRVLRAALGLPIQIVSGYKGTAEVRLAAEAGEVAGGCWSWESMRATWRKALDSGEAVPVVQMTPRPLRDLPGVPLAMSLAKTDEARLLLQTMQAASAYARPFAAPAGVPAERVHVLRRAFQATLEDREFLAETEKARLMIEPVTGEELQKLVAEVFALDPGLLARLRQILYN
jgi:tripartite-type tricarboxylate transporter receptor subunit TctC